MRVSRLAADGDGEDCFKETAEKVGELKTNLIVAEVGKQEYGDEENKALHERFNIDKDAWPVYKLFPKVRAPKVGAAARRLVSRARRTQGGGDPIDGPTKSEGSKDEQKAALGSFIKVNTGLSVFIGKGQIGAFDDLAEKFVGARCPTPFSAVRSRCYSALSPARSPGGDKGALAAAEKLLGDKEVVTDDDDKSNAEYYIKTMKRVNDKGADYPKTELARLKKSAPPNTELPCLRPPARRLPTRNGGAGTGEPRLRMRCWPQWWARR